MCVQSAQLSLSHAAGKLDDSFSIGRTIYTVDFTRMVQRNCKTGKNVLACNTILELIGVLSYSPGGLFDFCSHAGLATPFV